MSMRKLLLGLPVVMAALGTVAVTSTPALADNDHAPPWSQSWRHDPHPQRHEAAGPRWWDHAGDGHQARWGQDDHRWADAGRWHDGYRHAENRDHHPAPRWARSPWWWQR